jgi:hypothetical protein
MGAEIPVDDIMKTSKKIGGSQKLVSEIRLGRVRLAQAQKQHKAAKEQARAAKRRRKEARQAARRARKKAKLAKRGVAEAKQFLAEAQRKLALARRRKALAAARKRAAKRAASAAAKSIKPTRRKPGAGAPRRGNRLKVRMGQAVEEARGGGKTEIQKVAEPAAPTGPAPATDQPPTPNEALV